MQHNHFLVSLPKATEERGIRECTDAAIDLA